MVAHSFALGAAVPQVVQHYGLTPICLLISRRQKRGATQSAARRRCGIPRFSNAFSQRLLEAPCSNEDTAESASARSCGAHRGNGAVSIGRKPDGGTLREKPRMSVV